MGSLISGKENLDESRHQEAGILELALKQEFDIPLPDMDWTNDDDVQESTGVCSKSMSDNHEDNIEISILKIESLIDGKENLDKLRHEEAGILELAVKKEFDIPLPDLNWTNDHDSQESSEVCSKSLSDNHADNIENTDRSVLKVESLVHGKENLNKSRHEEAGILELAIKQEFVIPLPDMDWTNDHDLRESSGVCPKSISDDHADVIERNREKPLDNKGFFRFEVYDKTFTTRSSSASHKKILAGVKSFQCQVCDETFTTNGSLTCHKRIHTGIKPFQCQVCDKTFTTNSNMLRHKQIHTGIKPFQCEVCDKTFTSNTSLTSHKRIHTGKRPFQCLVCDKTFTTNGTLTSHKLIHTGKKTFQCQVCDKTFTNSGTLSYHKRIHAKEKMFQCKVCGKTFTCNSYLRCHTQIHTGVKLFQCQVCRKKFSSNGSLQVHKRIHAGIKPFQCQVCDKSFSTKGNLVRHINTHTEYNPSNVKLTVTS